ncbi:MAG: hypothetical protein ACTSR3_15390 [Candidatus Helarchaeota archaeon]
MSTEIRNLWGWYETVGSFGYNLQDAVAILDFINPFKDSPLYIFVENGTVSDLIIDNDEDTLKEVIINTSNSYRFLKMIDEGFHQISYKVYGDFISIKFMVLNEEITIRNLPELLDSDGDGLKDSIEIANGLDCFDCDTDNDNLMDGFDESPTYNITLDEAQIGQFIIPIKSETTSLLSLQIDKPKSDYSCTSRQWHHTLNVTILPAIRIFGSKWDRNYLETFYNKSILSYSLIEEHYNELGFGDFLPGNEADKDFTIIPLASSEKNLEVNLFYEPEHSAKMDNILDFRFDIIWLVIQYDSNENQHKVLHYYSINEPINIQSFTLKELYNVSYILANPDSMNENLLFSCLIENPSIGSIDDFNLKNDVIGIGNTSFYYVINNVTEDRIENPSLNNENEVLYLSGNSENIDILKQFKELLKGETLQVILQTIGKFELTYVIYSGGHSYSHLTIDSSLLNLINLVDQLRVVEYRIPTTFGIQQILDDRVFKVNYTIFSSGNSLLEITKISGGPIWYENILNKSLYSLNPHLNVFTEIYFEENSTNPSGISSLQFNEETDFRKHSEFIQTNLENIDNIVREALIEEAEIVQRVFNSTNNDSLLFETMNSFENIADWILQWIKDLDDIFRLIVESQAIIPDDFAELLWGDPEILRDLMIMLNHANELSVCQQCEIFYILKNKINNQLTYLSIIVQEDWYAQIIQTHSILNNMINKLAKTMEQTGKAINPVHQDILKNCKTKDKCLWYQKYSCSLKCDYGKGLRSNGLKLGLLGAVQVGVGIFGIITGLADIVNLVQKQMNPLTQKEAFDFTFRLCHSITFVALSSVSFISGTIVFGNLVEKITADALGRALGILGKVNWILGMALIVFDFANVIAQMANGQLTGTELYVTLIYTGVNAAATLIPLIAATISTSWTGWGSLIGIILIGIQILNELLSAGHNQPFLLVYDQEIILPEEEIQRDGSLTVGQTVKIDLKLVNLGACPMQYTAALAVGPPSVVLGDFGTMSPSPWIPPGWVCSLTISDTLDEASPEVNFHMIYFMQAFFIYYVFFIPVGTIVPSGNNLYAPNSGTIPIPVCEPSIEEFYDNTAPFIDGMEDSILKKFEDFEKAVEEYRFRDAYDIGQEIKTISETDAGINLDYFNYLNVTKIPWNDSYSLLHFEREEDFIGNLSK